MSSRAGAFPALVALLAVTSSCSPGHGPTAAEDRNSLLAAGEDLKTVSERLGHSTIKLTADTYAHVQESMKRRSADAREALLFGPATAAR